MENIKPYKKASDYSYTLGAFPTIELIKNQAEKVKSVLISSDYHDKSTIEALCMEYKINLCENSRMVERLSDKENVYVIGLFDKYVSKPEVQEPHIVLVNPGNMGNMGTILRTALGFGIKNIILIEPAADIFHPKTVRASMGALFHMKFCSFSSFQEYMAEYPNHQCFPFMLNAKEVLHPGIYHGTEPYSLVFGNEGSGLPEEFHQYGTSVLIPQSDEVDSLNITIAVAVAAYVFTQGYH